MNLQVCLGITHGHIPQDPVLAVKGSIFYSCVDPESLLLRQDQADRRLGFRHFSDRLPELNARNKFQGHCINPKP